MLQRAKLIGQGVIEVGQRILHPRAGRDLRNPYLMLSDAKQLRDTAVLSGLAPKSSE